MSDTSTSGRHARSVSSPSAADVLTRTTAPAAVKIALASSRASGSSSTTSTRRPPRGTRERGLSTRVACTVATWSVAASVQLDEMLHQCQTEPQTGVRASARGIGLAKSIEHERQHVGRDTLAGVAHDDLDARADTLGAHLHAAAVRREFHRVQHEVPHDLLQPIWIAADGTRARVEDGLDPDVLGLGGRPGGVEGLFDDALEVDQTNIEPHL